MRLGASGRQQIATASPATISKAQAPPQPAQTQGTCAALLDSSRRPGSRERLPEEQAEGPCHPEVGVAAGCSVLPQKDQHSPLQSHCGEHGSKITALLFQRGGEGRRRPDRNPGWLVGHQPKTRLPVPAASVVRVNPGCSWALGVFQVALPVSHHPAM